jgi:hypothetical protein
LQENGKDSKFLTLFNKLDEGDKNLVIAMSESLVEKCKKFAAPRVLKDGRRGSNKKHHI